MEEFKFNQTAEEISSKLENIGFKNTCLVEVNPFDMNDIIEKIVKVAEQEKDSLIYINITGGTNLMAGAACSASFFIGAKAYYVLDENKLPKNSTIEQQIIELRALLFQCLKREPSIILKALKKQSLLHFFMPIIVTRF